MDKRMETVKKIGRVLTVAVLLGVGAQLVMPLTADAKRAKCAAIPVPGKPGVYQVVCSTLRP